MNKNKKISNSLKKYHHKKRTKTQRHKELKIIAWILAFIALTGIYSTHSVIKPIQAEAPYAQMQGMLPDNPDKDISTLSVKDRILIEAHKACNKKELGDYCVNDLLAMAWTESRFNDKAVGDNGNSHGILQIHRGYHPDITIEQAQDISFAINWTLDRLLHFGYPEYRSYSVMKHNGTPGTEKTLGYLASVNSY